MGKRKRISQMRNLGPAVEKDLNAAGVFYASEVEALGAEQAFIKMLEGRKTLGRSASCCNALYLYSLYGAIVDIDWRHIPGAKKEAFKRFTKELRSSGLFS